MVNLENTGSGWLGKQKKCRCADLKKQETRDSEKRNTRIRKLRIRETGIHAFGETRNRGFGKLEGSLFRTGYVRSKSPNPNPEGCRKLPQLAHDVVHQGLYLKGHGHGEFSGSTGMVWGFRLSHRSKPAGTRKPSLVRRVAMIPAAPE